MSKLDDQIRATIEKQLIQNPKTPTVELYEQARLIKKSVGKLKLNQFRGRYVLAVSRKLSGKKPGPKKGARQKAVRSTKRKAHSTVLRGTFDTRKSAINEALESAYQRAIASDKISIVESLLSSMDKIRKSI